jgi:SET domain-containing protein
MLFVRTRLAPSSIHGLGLFAAEPIPRGAEVWRFTPGFDLDLDPALVENQPAIFRERLLHYGYIDSRLGRYILCCDDARFINHSDTPNLRTDLDGDRYGVDIAARDIAAGEEITIDYRWFE